MMRRRWMWRWRWRCRSRGWQLQQGAINVSVEGGHSQQRISYSGSYGKEGAPTWPFLNLSSWQNPPIKPCKYAVFSAKIYLKDPPSRISVYIYQLYVSVAAQCICISSGIYVPIVLCISSCMYQWLHVSVGGPGGNSQEGCSGLPVREGIALHRSGL